MSGARRGEEGLSALELVLIAPVLFLLLFVGVQVALWHLAGGVATSAARDGANAGANGAAGPAAAYQRATAILNGPGRNLVAGGSVAVSADSQYVTVHVDGRAPSLVPGLDLPVHASAASAVEQFRPER